MTKKYHTDAPDADWAGRWREAAFNPLAWDQDEFRREAMKETGERRAKLLEFVDAIPASIELHGRLVELGGWAVCMRDAGIAPLMLARGSDADGAGAEMRLGEPCQCHENCEELVEADPSLVWWYGYALSDDGMWREHSWCVRPDGGIVETTAERVAYFGTPEAEGRA